MSRSILKSKCITSPRDFFTRKFKSFRMLKAFGPRLANETYSKLPLVNYLKAKEV